MRVSRVIVAAMTFLFCLGLISDSISAQDMQTGSLEGKVLAINKKGKDPQPLSGASVRATNEATGLIKEVFTAKDGSWKITLLPPGLYTIRASKEEYWPVEIEHFPVQAGKNNTVDEPFVLKKQ